MKLLVVDDEPIILSSIKNIIAQSEFKDLEILTANNAAKAYDVINSNSPEIILTDIQMPKENGIHLLIKISELNYSPIVIFITGYSDFSCMQSALRYKAFDYLLKPITDTALIPCLKKAIHNWQEKEHMQKLSSILSNFYKENKQTIKKQIFENLLISPVSLQNHISQDQLISLGLNYPCFCMIGVKCNVNVTKPLQNQEYYIAYTLSHVISQRYPLLTSCYLGNCVYILYPVNNIESSAEEINQFAEYISHYVRKNLFSSISICISKIETDLYNTYKLNKQIQYCFSVNDTSAESDSNIIFYEDINEYKADVPDINENIFQLINAVTMRNLSLSQQYSRTFFEILKDMPLELQQDSLKLVVLNLHCQLRNVISNPVDIGYLTNPISRNCMPNPVSEESQYLFNNCISNTIQELSSLSSKYRSQMINTILEYVDQNYPLQIGLNNVAELIGRNPSYISRILKKELNKGFAQLLTERRLTAAKELLANTSLKIADISAKVGYTSPKYFHQVFINNMNMTPSDYRAIMNHF